MRVLVFALLLLGSVLPSARGQHPVGWRGLGLVNRTRHGLPILWVRLYYPAKRRGWLAPLQARPGGWPVIVLLPGVSTWGAWYGDLGSVLARDGFVVVVDSTIASVLPDLQVAEGTALHATLAAESRRAGAFLQGAVDLTRAGIAGWSLGGSSALRVLARNPGYLAGFCLAPWDGVQIVNLGTWFPPLVAPQVRVPIALVHGEGDWILGWKRSSQAWFDHARAFTGIKVFYRLDRSADHFNVIFDLPGGPFARTAALARSWFARYLRGDAAALEGVLGDAPRGDRRLVELQLGIEQPELWLHAGGRLGQPLELRLAAEPGAAWLLASAAPGSRQTPYGILRLDPERMIVLQALAVGRSRLPALLVPLPDLPVLAGHRLYLQVLAGGRGGALRLTGAVSVLLRR